MRWVAVLMVMVAGLANAQAGPERRITERVFFIPDPGASTVRFQMLVLAGCGDEPGGDCRGIAHYLEHLILVGRNSQHSDQALRFFADGFSNGWTNLKATGYVHSFPAGAADASARLEQLFAFYAARLRYFSITEQDAQRERAVVRQEYDWRYGGNAHAPMWKEVSRFLFPGHPMGQWAIGDPARFDLLTVEAARAFHAQWYRLSNVYLFVTGPVDEALVRTLAERHLAPLPADPPPDRVWLANPPALKPERIVLTHEDPRIGEPSVAYWKAVQLLRPDPIRLRAVVALLNEFLKSRITGSPHSHMVEHEEIALSVGAARIENGLHGVLQASLTVVPESDVPADRVAEATAGYFAVLADNGLDERTLGRLKRRLAVAHERQLADPQAAAARLSEWLSAGLPYERLKDFPAVVEELTLADIATVLRALADPGREAIVHYRPAGQP